MEREVNKSNNISNRSSKLLMRIVGNLQKEQECEQLAFPCAGHLCARIHATKRRCQQDIVIIADGLGRKETKQQTRGGSRFSCKFSHNMRRAIGANLFVDKFISGDIHRPSSKKINTWRLFNSDWNLVHGCYEWPEGGFKKEKYHFCELPGVCTG